MRDLAVPLLRILPALTDAWLCMRIMLDRYYAGERVFGWENRVMKTLRLKLPEATVARLVAAARKRSQSKSALVRAILEECLAEGKAAAKGSCLDVAADLAGCVVGPRDLSSQKRRLQGYGQ